MRTLCGKSTPRGRTLCGRLLPFGGLGFRILGSSPFPPPVVLLHGGAHSLGWNWQRRGPASARIIPPVSSFEGSGQGATSSIFSNTGFSKPSGRGAKHRIIFAFVSQSWSKSDLRNNFMMNKRQCVRRGDFLLVRWRGYCSGPRPG